MWEGDTGNLIRQADATVVPPTPATGTAAARGAGEGRFVPGVDPDTIVTPRVGSDTRFLELAAAQRGNAERLGTDAMMDAGGSGIRQFLTESIGDIIQRMSRQMPDDYSATIEKVQRGISDLRRPNFADDLERQLRSNYDYGVEKGTITESFEAHKAGILDIQSQYAVAHSKLPVINQAHRDAQAAAVAFGEQRYADSLAALRRIESHLGSQEAFDAYRLEGAQPVTQAPTTPARGPAAARGAGAREAAEAARAVDDTGAPLRAEGQFTPPRAIGGRFIDKEFRGTGGTAGRLPTDDEFIRMRDTVPEILAKPLGTLPEEDIARLGQVSANNRTPATVQNALGIRVWQETAFKKGKPLTVEQMTNAYPLEQRLIGGYSIEELGIESGAFVRQADGTVVPPTTPATGRAAARQVTPQQQAIIDDVGTGALPADDVAVDALDAAPVARAADDASLRAIEGEAIPVDFVDATGTAKQGSARVVAKSADIPSDVGGVIPPERVIVDPPVTGGPEGSLFEPLQDFQTQMDVAFNPNIARRIGEQTRNTGVGRVFTGFDPSLAAQTPGERSVITYANLLDEGKNKAQRINATFEELGQPVDIFSSQIDDFGVFTEGPFVGRTLNEVAENPLLRRQVTPAQAEYLDNLTKVDKQASQFLRDHAGRDVGFIDEGERFFAARRIYALLDPDSGELLKASPAPRSHVGMGAKTSSEKARVIAEAEDLRKKGYILLPYNETVKLKVEQAYRAAAEEEWVNWAKKNFKLEDRPPGKQSYKDAQQRLFRQYVGGDAEAIRMMGDAEEALNQFRKAAPEGKVATLAKLVANIGMSLSLAGDASIFTIHYLRLLGWDALPATTFGKNKLQMKMPFGVTARSSKAFSKQFVTALWSPKKASALNQHVISSNFDSLRGNRSLILFGSEEVPELGEGFRGLRKVDDYFSGLSTPKRILTAPAAAPVRFVVASNEALSAAMNASGIYLNKAMKSLTKNADGTINPQKLQDVEDWINNIRGVTSSARLATSPSRRYTESMALLAPRLRRASAALSYLIIEGGLRGQMAREAMAGLIAGITLASAALVIARGKAEGKSDAQIKHELENTLVPGGSQFGLHEVGAQ